MSNFKTLKTYQEAADLGLWPALECQQCGHPLVVEWDDDVVLVCPAGHSKEYPTLLTLVSVKIALREAGYDV